jgi:hypothetical protein
VAENLDRPMSEWSDDQLLEEYRYTTGDLPERAGKDRPDKSEITEEILRRGLPFPDVPTVPKPESWTGAVRPEEKILGLALSQDLSNAVRKHGEHVRAN